MSFKLLLLTLTILFQLKFTLCSLRKSIVLPLKRQAIPNRLGFEHNVTLTVSLAIASPPQQVTMVLDTGSEIPWLHCKNTPATPKFFNLTRSTSYSPVPCNSPTCWDKTQDFINPVSCDAKKLCHIIVSYADATSVEGNLAMDTFLIENSSLPGVVFGYMDARSSSNPDEDAKTTGLIGMNRGSLSFVNQLGITKFSYCISGRGSLGVMIFGEGKFQKQLSYTPLIQISTPLPSFDRAAYTVQPVGIKVGDKMLDLPKSAFVPDHTGAGQTKVDSGTQFTFLLGPVYTALKDEFVRQTSGILTVLPDFVFQGAMDLCFQVHSTLSQNIPVVALMFTDAEITVSAERLLYRVPSLVQGGDSIYCFTFGNSDLLGVEAFIIGHHHQQDHWIEYDLANNRFGFVEANCDTASQRLGLVD